MQVTPRLSAGARTGQGSLQERPSQVLPDGYQEGQNEAGSTARCLGLSRREQRTTPGALPSLREHAGVRLLAFGSVEAGGHAEVSEEQTELGIRKRVHLEHLPDLRTKMPAPDGVSQAPTFPASSLLPLLLPWTSETEVSKMDKGQNIRPG